MKIFRSIFTAVLIAFLFSSCIEDDIGNIGSEISLTPEYAIPIGSPEFEMDEFFTASALGIPLDTSDMNDTSSFMEYDNQFYQTIYSVEHTETFPVNLASLESSQELFISIMFRTNAINKIPARIQSQAYFLNASSVIIDSLYNSPLILEAAQVDEFGELIQAYELWEYDVYLSQEKLEQFTQVSYIQVSSKLYTNNATEILSFYSSQALWIQLGAKIKLDLSENEQ